MCSWYGLNIDNQLIKKVKNTQLTDNVQVKDAKTHFFAHFLHFSINKILAV